MKKSSTTFNQFKPRLATFRKFESDWTKNWLNQINVIKPSPTPCPIHLPKSLMEIGWLVIKIRWQPEEMGKKGLTSYQVFYIMK